MSNPIPKDQPFRSKRLRELAKEVPHCFYCKEVNHGQVVLAHSNRLNHGKGMGMKAHDVPNYLCELCHGVMDGRIKQTDPNTPLRIQLDGTYGSIVWLLKNGYLEVK